MANLDLSKYGITDVKEILHNPSYEVLFAEETKESLEGYEKGQVTELGAVNVMTGIYTGRSPKDKFFVYNEASKDTVWWTSDEYKNDNKPCSEEAWADLKAKAVKQLSGKRLFVMDTFCGANPATRLKVRFIMEVAWQAHFVKNMFIRPTEEELANYGEPDFVSFNAAKTKVDNYKELGLNSETATVFNLKTNEQVILNTWYGGEMKKGIFSIMNYLNPLRGIASMHCSANTNMEGTDTAIFFGLSGTGKTTLSTDPKRLLIGDDEHGWDDEGVFNYEGGCYAKVTKVINLDKESEPDIYNAIKRDALLENVTVDANGKIDFADKSVTENTRVSYPIYHINNIVKPVSKGPHAHQVIFLSADAFGVLPPVSILDAEQAKYYFLSGFTAKLAGTERGITEPTPTFSACFGAAFLSLHPTKLRRWKRLARRLTWLTQVGTVLASVSLSVILVVSSMLSWTVLSTRLRPRLFRSSTSWFRQNCRVLIRRSLILVTLTTALASGKKKQKTWLLVSSRTSLSSKVTKQARLWLLLVRNCNYQFLSDKCGRPSFKEGRFFIICTGNQRKICMSKIEEFGKLVYFCGNQ